MTRIILLDIDGVLVQPGGYRAALRATVQRFVGDIKIEEDVLTGLEKQGISSEWDMAPLIIASYWDFILSKHPMPHLPDKVSAAAQQIGNQYAPNLPVSLTIPEFDLVIGQYPAETAFHAGCFQHIPEKLQSNLLTNSRNIHKSETMRIFQQFTLGSQTYMETYQLPVEFDSESLLRTKDKTNINAAIRERLKHPENRLVAFTARPSHPPREVTVSTLGYAPEAEMALELVGLKDVPLIAFGKLEYIAAQHGLDPAILVKPSPFQALAGILAAWNGDEISALKAAYDWHNTGKLNSGFSELPRRFELVVVEDTLGGIRSTMAAGKILQDAGFDVTVRAFGLTSDSKAKAKAFDNAGIDNFKNWTELISALS